MALRITPNPRAAGRLSIAANQNARMSSIVSIDWANVTDKPATITGIPSAYVIGDILYAGTTTDLSRLADVASGNALISGGVGAAPSWGKVGLTTHISDVLGAANGGTGVANNAASTITITGAFGTTFTVNATTALTLPSSGTLATLAGTEELDNKTLDSSVAKGTWTASGTWTIPAVTLGGTVSGGGNQINNVIIGTSTPLAGTFTALGATSSISLTNNQNGNTFVTGTNTNAGSGANTGFGFTSDAGTLNLFVRSTAGGGRPDYIWNGTGSMLFWQQNASPGDMAFAFGGSLIVPLTLRPDGPIFGSAIASPAPATKTGNYTVLYSDQSLIFNGSGSITLTLMSAASYPGRWLYVKNIAAFTVVSASSNVVPRAGGAAGTAILPGTAGAWAWLQSNGTNWEIMASS